MYIYPDCLVRPLITALVVKNVSTRESSSLQSRKMWDKIMDPDHLRRLHHVKHLVGKSKAVEGNVAGAAGKLPSTEK